MDETQQLIAEIDDFLAKTGMAPSTLGQKAVRNWRVVETLKSGGNTGIRTAARLRDYMRQYSGARAA